MDLIPTDVVRSPRKGGGAVRSRLARRPRALQGESGFGIVELVFAMAMLAVGILAVFALFSTTSFAIQRASTVTTAATIADSRMEGFRAVTYPGIGFTAAAIDPAVTDSTYEGDSAYGAPGASPGNSVTVASSTTAPTATVTGADGKPYRVDTYITWQAVAGGRNVKRITVVVRDSVTPTKTWTRVVSTFDQATG